MCASMMGECMMMFTFGIYDSDDVGFFGGSRLFADRPKSWKILEVNGGFSSLGHVSGQRRVAQATS